MAAFDAAMVDAAPFERTPLLAIGISGGPDSMALCLLADNWARARGGCAIGLTVDHGLRPESSVEARRVSSWMKDLAVRHHVLVWRHDHLPRTGIQEKARAERRNLLTSWCEAMGIVHLLLGHHRRDQAETVLMRQQRSPVGDGLAGMSPVWETSSVRILRPLLTVPPDVLRAVLSQVRVPWIEDPSNEDLRYERVRMRQALPRDIEPAIKIGHESACARADADSETARLLADVFSYRPGGYAWGDLLRLSVYQPDCAARAIGRLVRTVSGRGYLPRGDRLRNLAERILGSTSFTGATLGGCRFTVQGDRLLICREASSVSPEISIAPGETVEWDQRFRIRLGKTVGSGTYTVGALTATGWQQIRRDLDPRLTVHWPAAARNVLPALRRSGRVIEVPHLTCAMAARHVGEDRLTEIAPSVPEPLVNGRFFIASVLE